MSNKNLAAAAKLILFFAAVTTIPSLLLPLGFPAENDAIAYRVPMLKWILRHYTYPNWDWSFVDDYPLLGEILMLPLFSIFPGLARLISIIAYFGIAIFSALSLATFCKGQEKKLLVLLAAAWIIALRPLTIQSNLLMVDNIATFFVVGSLYFVLKEQRKIGAIFLGLALATRYSAWGAAPGILLMMCWTDYRKQKFSIKNICLFVLISSLFAMPFMVRNYLLNDGNPFFPLLDKNFKNTAYEVYGRGKSFLSLLLLPYDLFVTNTFIQPIFDYSIGLVFYLQFIFALFGVYLQPKTAKDLLVKATLNTSVQGISLFFLVTLLFWFYGSQQLRFFVINIILINLILFYLAYKCLPPTIFICILLIGSISIASIQRERLQITFGFKAPLAANTYKKDESCISKIPANALIAFRTDTTLGFFNRDYIYLNAYRVPLPEQDMPRYEFIYDSEEIPNIPGFKPWPSENPCALRREPSNSS